MSQMNVIETKVGGGTQIHDITWEWGQLTLEVFDMQVGDGELAFLLSYTTNSGFPSLHCLL